MLHTAEDRLPRGTLGERGSASLELVILAPALLLILSVIIFAGRVAIAGQSVQQAAEEAARTASLARSRGDANTTAAAAARDTLAQQGLECTAVTVNVDTSGFNAPIGQPATVTATVTCPVKVGDLMIPGLPGTRTVKATASSPIDEWRQR